MIRAILIVLAAALAGEASACVGDPARSGATNVSARQLATARGADLRAGGTVVLGLCPDLPGTGHVPFEPSAVFDFTADLRGRGLEFRTEGSCDAVLLVRTARGNWYFDDDAAGEGNARLVIANPRSGRYAVWVGSFDAFGCDARLVLRTVRPGR